jgi:hypothetical protein
MLLIPGNTDVADVYLTEYARIFNHFYARWWAAQLETKGAGGNGASFLAETDTWQAPHFAAGHPKCFQRVLYASQVEGNQP